uniref:Globin n=1 Tax=Dolabella auricularia TaxID=6511 RepID=GLB_DOLAU|nr:RecName: Full=Globin; AltName: Full=Myoglobin [Dolabella auricularia]
ALSAAEAEVVAKSWGPVFANKDANGDNFLIALFEAYPDSPNFFADFKGKSIADIRASPKLRNVSSRIVSRLNEFVSSAADAGKMAAMLDQFSKEHAGFGVGSQQFQNVSAMFPGFVASIAAPPAGADAAWGKLFGLIIDAMKKAGK